jgi:hypothetical protein
MREDPVCRCLQGMAAVYHLMAAARFEPGKWVMQAIPDEIVSKAIVAVRGEDGLNCTVAKHQTDSTLAAFSVRYDGTRSA